MVRTVKCQNIQRLAQGNQKGQNIDAFLNLAVLGQRSKAPLRDIYFTMDGLTERINGRFQKDQLLTSTILRLNWPKCDEAVFIEPGVI